MASVQSSSDLNLRVQTFLTQLFISKGEDFAEIDDDLVAAMEKMLVPDVKARLLFKETQGNIPMCISKFLSSYNGKHSKLRAIANSYKTFSRFPQLTTKLLQSFIKDDACMRLFTFYHEHYFYIRAFHEDVFGREPNCYIYDEIANIFAAMRKD